MSGPAPSWHSRLRERAYGPFPPSSGRAYRREVACSVLIVLFFAAFVIFGESVSLACLAGAPITEDPILERAFFGLTALLFAALAVTGAARLFRGTRPADAALRAETVLCDRLDAITRPPARLVVAARSFRFRTRARVL